MPPRNTRTTPTMFRRNDGLTVRGVTLCYDPSLYISLDMRDSEGNQAISVGDIPSDSEEIKASDSAHNINFLPLNANAVRCRESLNRPEWELNFFKSQAKSESRVSHSQSSEVRRYEGGSRDDPPTLIPRNQAGQRVDPPIEFDKERRIKMQKERWCSNYHLKGFCPINDCYFRHGFLDGEGKNALLSLTRGNYCRNGNGCNVEDCYAGHHCPYEPCTKEKACHFPPDMHVMDKQIVNIDNLLTLDSRRVQASYEQIQREGNG